MEPASSSEDDDSSTEEVRSVSSASVDKATSLISNFDDLPSEDSCLESDSDDCDDSNSSDEETEEMTLEDRIYAKQHKQGVKRDPKVSEKKRKALEIAQKRLKDLKRKRAGENEDSVSKSKERKQDKKKKSKHTPTCVSSLRNAHFSRGAPELNSSGIGVAIGQNRYKPRDPRHQSLSGHFDQNVFEERYEFLEKIQDDEIEKLKERCKAWKMTGKQGQRKRKKLGLTSGDTDEVNDQAELNRLIQERAARSNAKIQTAAKRTVKKKLKEDVASGKKGAYYLKKRELKTMELEAKFEELKKIGGDKKVNEAIARRRKKKMGKDSSLMPAAI